MSKITWEDSYSVNVALFDEHHRQLVKIINELDHAVHNNRGTQKLDLIFSKLIEYTQIHFDSEETILAQNRFPGLPQQKEEHARFVDNIKFMRQQYKAGNIGLDHQVLDFLRNWLIGHILQSDQQYSDFLNAHGVS